MADAPHALPYSLRPHLFVVAQSSRAVVRAHHPEGYPPRVIPQRQGKGEALHLGRYLAKIERLCERIPGTGD